MRPAVVQYKGGIIKAVTCTPLHVFHGLGGQMLYVVETSAAILGDTCKQLDGSGVPALQQLRLNKCTSVERCVNLRRDDASCQKGKNTGSLQRSLGTLQ